MSRNAIVASTLLSLACGGSSPPAAPPAASPPLATESTESTESVAFTLTSTTTNEEDGSTRIHIYRGAEDGTIKIESDGETRVLGRALADGTFEVVTLRGETRSVRFDGDGETMVVADKPAAHRITISDDGGVASNGHAVFHIDGQQVVDVTGVMLTSEVLVEGKLSRFTKAILFDGTAAAKRRVAFLMAYELYAMVRQSKLENLGSAKAE